MIIYILIFLIDLIMFLYFARAGLLTTNIETRMICCIAMTYEIYLMRKFFKLLKTPK